MRILIFILLLICITDTVIPCCEFDGCSDEIAASNTDNEQKGACSPFFTCASCQVAAVTAKAVSFELPAVVATAFYPSYQSSSLSSYHDSFWQPPRIS